MGAICEYFGVTRQSHHKHCQAEQRRAVIEQKILGEVHQLRRQMPQLGTRKLYWLLGPELRQQGISYGRDKFFALLGRHGLLIERKRRSARTTDSKHFLRVYANLLANREVTGPHQAMVGDITYVRTRQGFRYLSLIMDSYSRRVIGWDVSGSLTIEGSLRALTMAIKQLPPDLAQRPLHHSDRGVQYCSHAYIGLLQRHKMLISMAATGNPYENAQAERLNGILKQEFLLDACFDNESQARRAVAEAIDIYNTQRPHMALMYQTPQQVHARGSINQAS
jgi:transposase InsO family protein